MFFNLILILNVVFATAIIAANSLLYIMLCLVFLIIGSCFILFSLKVEFLSFLFLLIYMGAIIILFLFVIMMLQLNKMELDKSLKTNFYIYSLFYLILFIKSSVFFCFFNIKLSLLIECYSSEFLVCNDTINNLLLLSDSSIFLNLFTENFFLFILVGIILLFSMVGSIALCIK